LEELSARATGESSPNWEFGNSLTSKRSGSVPSSIPQNDQHLGVRQFAAAFGFPVSSSPFAVEILCLKRETGNGKRLNGNGASELAHSKGLFMG